MWKLWHKHQIPAEFRDYDSVSGRTAPPTQLRLLHTHAHTLTHTSNLHFLELISTVTYGLHFLEQFLVLLLLGSGNCARPLVLSAHAF